MTEREKFASVVHFLGQFTALRKTTGLLQFTSFAIIL